MSKISEQQINKIIDTLEAMIDARYEYLQEKNYENHYNGRKILEEKYNPSKDILEKLLKDI
jgi:uncharacterized protein YkuJ